MCLVGFAERLRSDYKKIKSIVETTVDPKKPRLDLKAIREERNRLAEASNKMR